MSSREEYTSVPLAESEQAGEVSDVVIPAVPVATARPLMEVIAPATLREGFEFYVTGGPNNQTVKVAVPLGGVEKGQSFQVPFSEKAHPALPPGVSIPVGHWRDGLYDCFKHGICHPHLWISLFCPLIAVGQVIHRMELEWTGQVTHRPESKAVAFTILWIITAANVIILFGARFCLAYLVPAQNGSTDLTKYSDPEVPVSAKLCLVLYHAWTISFALGVLIISCNARRSVRKRYAIPTNKDCVECGDYACIFFCRWCAVAQMLRHTTDYEVYPSYCLSASGVPPSAPMIV